MVVDGRIQLVGSDERGAIEAIQNATKAEKIPVSLSSVHFDGPKILLHIEHWPVAFLNLREVREVLLAIADESDQSSVSRGENAGRTLRHVAVLREPCPSWGVGSVRQIFSGCRRSNPITATRGI